MKTELDKLIDKSGLGLMFEGGGNTSETEADQKDSEQSFNPMAQAQQVTRELFGGKN